MSTEVANGNQTAVVTTEHSLTTQTTDGAYQAWVDLSNMVAGDEVEIRVKVKPRGSSSARLEAQYLIFVGVQSIKPKYTEAVFAAEFELTLKQTAGTARMFEWGVQFV